MKKMIFSQLLWLSPCLFISSFMSGASELDPPSASLESIAEGWTVGEEWLKALRDRDINTLMFLIQAGVDVNLQDQFRRTALMRAANKPHSPECEKLIRALLAAGAAVSATDYCGRHALMYAVAVGNNQITRLLLAAGSNVNLLNNDEETALMIASFNGHEPTVPILLAAGADHKLINKDGKTALNLAKEALTHGLKAQKTIALLSTHERIEHPTKSLEQIVDNACYHHSELSEINRQLNETHHQLCQPTQTDQQESYEFYIKQIAAIDNAKKRLGRFKKAALQCIARGQQLSRPSESKLLRHEGLEDFHVQLLQAALNASPLGGPIKQRLVSIRTLAPSLRASELTHCKWRELRAALSAGL